jgi:hypothetical protein
MMLATAVGAFNALAAPLPQQQLALCFELGSMSRADVVVKSSLSVIRRCLP